MKTEIEVKFLNVNHDHMRTELSKLGAVCVSPMRLMRRAIIDFSDRRLQTGMPISFIRVRDEGEKIALTYKQFNSLSIDGAKEIEVEVSSFNDTIAIFTSIGMQVCSVQESRREIWEIDGCEVALDEWPWLNTYIEIEGESEKLLKDVAAKLGFNWSAAAFGDVMVAYRNQYPHLTEEQTVSTLPEVRFDMPLPNFLNMSLW